MSTQNLNINDYSGFIHSCQNLEAMKMSFCLWMCKQTVLHTDNGILFNAKKINELSSLIRYGETLNSYY